MRISRSEFARAAGVSRAAVTKAIAAGWLVVEPDGRTLDPGRPPNARYLSDHVAGFDVLWRQTGRPGPGLPKIADRTIFQALELRNAIRHIDQFAGRYRGLPGVAEFARPLRKQLMERLDGAQTVQIDTMRRQRRPRLKTID